MDIPITVEPWVRAMRRTPQGRQVVKNLEQEENVSPKISRKFFQALSRVHKSPASATQRMQKVLKSLPECALCGPTSRLGMAFLTRFAMLARLADHPALVKAGVGFQQLVAMPHLVDKITEMELGNRRGIVWAASNKPLEEDIKRGFTAERVVNKLGISPKLEEPMYRVIYNTNDIDQKCHVPTVLDAGDGSRFRPPKKGAPHGMTKPCKGTGGGYPECVHGKCSVDKPRITVHAAS